MRGKSILIQSLLCLLFLLKAHCPAATGRIIYINDNANGLNDGSTWASAKGCLTADANYPEQPVYFADANLKRAVEINLGITNPTSTDMLELDKLDAYSGEISDLTGLEYAANLRILNLTRNQISDISPISGLTNLQRLYLSDNQISDISPLSGLTNLQHTNLSNNQIGNNLSPLSGLVNLIDLGLQGNQISDISPLSELKNLLWLFLGGNQISDLSPLSGLSKLETIWLSNNQISDISPLSELTNLQNLYLSGNQISDISSVSGLTNLERLKLGDCQIADLSPLSGLTNLRDLYLIDNLISDISPLSGLTNLEELNLGNNQISDISPLSGIICLQMLYLGSNQINDISLLFEFSNLQRLDIGYNRISDISGLSGLTGLEWLRLSNNQISDLSPLSELTNLKDLSLNYNQISDISPLSGLINLQELNIWFNPLGADAYNIYIPLIERYGTNIYYDPPVWRTLTISSAAGGSVTVPGEGNFNYTNGTIVDILVAADQGYNFVEWTGTAVDAGKVADPYSAGTMVTMDADYVLQANFEPIEVTLIYVDDDATGVNNGTSWENAYVCLQDALTSSMGRLTADAETAEKPIEIRVAQGIYRPDQRAMIRQDKLRIVSSGDWTATFQLIDNVAIKGGYAGLGEPDPDARDINQYESVLSGDLNADDDPDFANIWDNSYHVVTASGTQWTAILDGFTITGGNADGPFPYDNGGGIYNVEGSPMLIDCTLRGNSTTGNGGGMHNSVYSVPVLINCTFSGNLADMTGGGMYNDKSGPMLTNCTFSENMGGGGGGMYNDGGIPMLADCDFTGNSTTGSGGAIYNNGSDPFLLGCLFSANSASRSGGGMYNRYTSQPLLTNCIFSSNSADRGGAMENLNTSQPTLINCTFSANFAESTGGGTSNLHNSRLTLINCILWGDVPDEISGSAYVSYSDIEGDWMGVWMNNIDINPLFVDPDNGDYHLKSQAGRWDPKSERWVIDDVTSPCIDAGDPNIPVGLERFPNGDRINMGTYGGTPEASLSPSQLLPLPAQASNPDPPDGTMNVSPDVIVSWSPGENAVSHDVYFGFTNPPEFVGNQIETEYDPPGMLPTLAQCYWRIDEIDSQGNIIPGKTWRFTVHEYKGRACFTGETRVWIDGAAIAISNVAAGQNIRHLNISGKVETVQEHEGTFVCYDVLLESGNCITIAENHYFMSESGQWISLKNLKDGTRLKTAKGLIEIESITKQPKLYVGKVYNLKVEGSDRYLVGEDAVIVRDY